MGNDIYLIGEIGVEVTLQTVKEAVESSDKTKPLNIRIHSEGGYVYDGEAIYNYLKGISQEVNTYALGLVASMASIIFLAGKNRIAYRPNNVLIHLPLGGATGNAIDLENGAKELRRLEDTMSSIYATETRLSKEEALEMMRKDEMVTLDVLLEKGIITKIEEFKAVAKFNKNHNKMSNLTEEDKGFFAKAFGQIEALLKKDPVAKMITDATGAEIDFTDVADDATPVIGDKATVDGKPAEGSYTMPSEDEAENGDVWVFVAGELTEITPAESEGDDAEALKAENETLKQELETLKAEAVENSETVAKLNDQFGKIKAKLGSNFEYVGKTKKEVDPNAKTTRSFHGKKD